MGEQEVLLEKARQALERSHMHAYVVETPEQAREKAASFLTQGCSVAVGGSVTLRETGIQQMLETGPYQYTDRYVKGTFAFDNELEKNQIKQSYLDAYTADVYFSSANAVTLDGQLVFVDGQGNRVSAVAYGPRKVIIVVGINKIVENIEAAFVRIRTVAAPRNNLRYERTTPCVKTGCCVDCRHPDRGCSDYLIVANQREKDRIHVILVKQELGF